MIARDRAVEALRSDEFDLVVVGGGITGAGVALDAASRGYSVALVERGDYAIGTSSRSSKLVHGGLRYLQNFDLGLVREALLERALLVRLAPHLVRPLPLVVPAFGGARPDLLVGIGLNMYDVMATTRRGRRRGRRGHMEELGAPEWNPARHRVIPGEEVLELLPALAEREPTSGYLFYDCQTDDARLVLTVLEEAERFGTVCANRIEVRELIEEDGVAGGVRVHDRETGERFDVRADSVINATGVWADRIRPEELHDAAEVPVIRPSRGSHLTLDPEALLVHAGAIVPASGGRTIFVLPWLGRTLVGTTDNDYDGDIDAVQPSLDDINYLLQAVNGYFRTTLRPHDVAGAYAGVRPLISSADAKKSVDISRKAELYETGSGMITITGGKLTTWRRMAKLAVDRLTEREGREAPCRTQEIPLGQPVAPEALPRVEGVAEEAYAHLAGRYGYAAVEVLELAAARGELAQPVVPECPDLLAEATWAARRQQARSVADVLLRRTRLGLLAARTLTAEGDPAPERVARAMAGELGWDDAAVAEQSAQWARSAAVEGIAPGEEPRG